MKDFYDFLFVGIKESLSHLYQETEQIEEILDQHTEIFRAIKNHDPEQAYRFMKRHITYVRDFFKERS